MKINDVDVFIKELERFMELCRNNGKYLMNKINGEYRDSLHVLKCEITNE